MTHATRTSTIAEIGWRGLRLTGLAKATLAMAVAVGGLVSPASASQFKIIYDFKNTPDGRSPFDVVVGPGGTLYGETSSGGTSLFCGTVFQIVPPAAGQTAWKESVIYPCTSDPQGVIVDQTGALYGVEENGGSDQRGSVFKLSPPAAGHTTWTISTLYSFSLGAVNSAGFNPVSKLVRDSAGNLFGTTQAGGASNDGTAYELSPPASGSGSWTFTLLASFPYSGRINGFTRGADGSFYGQAWSDLDPEASYPSAGIIYKLSRPASGVGAWTLTTIQDFGMQQLGVVLPGGEGLAYSPIADRSLTLFGETLYGGTGLGQGDGTVYKLDPPQSRVATRTKSILYTFKTTGGGVRPTGRLVEDSSGVLYGITLGGGSGCSPNPANCSATVFRLVPRDYGGHKTPWNFYNLHTFVPSEGSFPLNLVGTTLSGGTFALFGAILAGDAEHSPNGAVFEVIP